MKDAKEKEKGQREKGETLKIFYNVNSSTKDRKKCLIY
jgi:hypothetical protein